MNNLYPCPDCGTQVSKTANVCPKCGRKLNSPENVGNALASLLGMVFTIWFMWKFGVFKMLWQFLKHQF